MALPIREQMKYWGAVTALFLVVLWFMGDVLLPFVLGGAVAYFLDPVADKVLVLGTFAALCVLDDNLAPWWAVGLIAGRDLFVTVLRVWYNRQGKVLKTSSAAKWKTTFQLTFLIAVLLLWAAVLVPGEVGEWSNWLLYSMIIKVLLWATVLVTVLTGIAYARAPAFDAEFDEG